MTRNQIIAVQGDDGAHASPTGRKWRPTIDGGWELLTDRGWRKLPNPRNGEDDRNAYQGFLNAHGLTPA